MNDPHEAAKDTLAELQDGLRLARERHKWADCIQQRIAAVEAVVADLNRVADDFHHEQEMVSARAVDFYKQRDQLAALAKRVAACEQAVSRFDDHIREHHCPGCGHEEVCKPPPSPAEMDEANERYGVKCAGIPGPTLDAKAQEPASWPIPGYSHPDSYLLPSRGDVMALAAKVDAALNGITRLHNAVGSCDDLPTSSHTEVLRDIVTRVARIEDDLSSSFQALRDHDDRLDAKVDTMIGSLVRAGLWNDIRATPDGPVRIRSGTSTDDAARYVPAPPQPTRPMED